MELKFIKSGDYYIPDIKLKEPNIRLGKWGADAKVVSANSTAVSLFGDGTERNAISPLCGN